MPPMYARLALIFLFFATAAAAFAQAPLAGAGSVAVERESHGWVVSPATGVHNAAVLHLPPRIDPGAEQGATTDGAVRQVAMLPKAPVALAAWNNRVYMVFGPTEVREGRLQRPVLVAGTVRGAIGGHWLPEAEGRRLPVLASLPGEGDLLGVVGTTRGPAALLDHGAAHEDRFQLLVLGESTWREAPLPGDFMERIRLGPAAARVGLVAQYDGFGIFVAGAGPQGSDGVWSGVLRVGEDVEIDWSWRPLRFVAADGAPAPLPETSLFPVAGQFSYVARSMAETGVEVWTVAPGSGPNGSDGGAWRLAHLPDVTAEWAAAPLEGAGRVAIVWAERIPGRAARADRGQTPREGEPPADTDEEAPVLEVRRFIAEVSVHTGAIFYEGPVRIRGPVSPQELRLLALVVVALMAVIVVFILRPEPQAPPLTLPPGYALAEPGRRIAGSIIDLVAAAFIASQFLNVGLWELLTLRGILMPGGVGLSAVLAVIGVGFVLTTLGEWLAGRSLGKFITGCEVVRPVIDRTAEGVIVPSVQPTGPWRAAVRNLVKWTIPPVAMAGLGTPERRHRGDLAAGTVVVIRVEEPEPA